MGSHMRSWVPEPRMIWAVGINYRDHAAETGMSLPAAPTLFAKSPGSVIGPDAPIVIPPHVTHPITRVSSRS
jgi:2-keto-4-pentenoate hydratase/2-oxohepta-3-ene-1,7-dioic acid hydratase in catechol pathway